ncbi:MAG: flagellar basal body L-ring protein FlgH [Planctomycetota bacterium]
MRRRHLAHLLHGILIAALVATASAVEGQSLWKRGGEKNRRSIYIREKKTRPPIEKNDIVLVLVLEQATASNDARLDSQRKLEADMVIDSFLKFEGKNLKPTTNPQPGIEFEGNRKLQSRGKTDRKENIRLRVAAKVVDVRPNGNLVLEARKERRINDEATTVILTGMVRSDDVGADYSVASDRLADMKLSYTGKGPVSRNSGWTWLTWLIDHIWPF